MTLRCLLLLYIDRLDYCLKPWDGYRILTIDNYGVGLNVRVREGVNVVDKFIRVAEYHGFHFVIWLALKEGNGEKS